MWTRTEDPLRKTAEIHIELDAVVFCFLSLVAIVLCDFAKRFPFIGVLLLLFIALITFVRSG